MNTKLWAKIFGIIFVLIGVLGFVPGITSNGHLLGIFEVDTIHNIVHILTGVVALLVMKSSAGSRNFFKIFGVVYALVAILGFLPFGKVLGLFHVNMADNILHVVIAAIALKAGFLCGNKKMSESNDFTPTAGASMGGDSVGSSVGGDSMSGGNNMGM